MCPKKLNHNDKTKITGGPKYLHSIIKIIIIEGNKVIILFLTTTTWSSSSSKDHTAVKILIVFSHIMVEHVYD